jgi:simple sugar transport system ATP-binding protein
MSEPALEARRVAKSFGALRALAGVDAIFQFGEIHAVLGENGAGKSTLMNVLAGFLRPDSGEVFLKGAPAPIGNPRALREKGVSLVHQHFMLVPEFSVLENLALDQMSSRLGAVPTAPVLQKAEAQAVAVGWTFDFTARTGDLPVGIQQRIEILKALATDARILILDEPTAVLSPDETQDLFQVLRRLREQGRAIILIAHKLSEVFAIADRVTVLRRGEVTGAAAIKDVDTAELSHWMVGDLLTETVTTAAPGGDIRIRAESLTVKGDRGETAVQNAAFEIRAGEILGIAGVDGNGQLELAEAVAGVRPKAGGQITIDGVASYIPQDRRRDGLALDMAIWENLIDPRSLSPWLSPARETARADELRERFDIRAETVQDRPRQLSGGNQQKVVVARELSRAPQVIVAMNPTRGLDLNATRFVHSQLRAAAAGGAAILLISTDLDEIAALSHRRLNISRGRLTEGGVQEYLGAAP